MILRRLNRWLASLSRRNPDKHLRPSTSGPAAQAAAQPYAAREIARAAARPVFVNNWMEDCFVDYGDGRGPIPIANGEFGPQCDQLELDDVVVAMDERYLYLSDGRRLALRRPLPGGRA